MLAILCSRHFCLNYAKMHICYSPDHNRHFILILSMIDFSDNLSDDLKNNNIAGLGFIFNEANKSISDAKITTIRALNAANLVVIQWISW